MDIAVAIRLMPNVGDELEIDSDVPDIDRELVEMVMNEFDDQALEEAVLLKEATGATVTAVGLRADGIEQALRVASRAGADRAVIVESGELDPYDSRTAASAFARRCVSWRRSGADRCAGAGRRVRADRAVSAVDLGWPQANVVVGVSPSTERRGQQEYSGGRLAGWVTSCRRWSACNRRALRRGTCRWAACGRR